MVNALGSIFSPDYLFMIVSTNKVLDILARLFILFFDTVRQLMTRAMNIYSSRFVVLLSNIDDRM
jgi:hypothetical protein